MMDLSISVVSHGHGQLLRGLLTTLEANRPDLSLEVLLILNTPESDPTFELELSFPVRVYKNRTPLGYGANHNLSLQRANGRCFCVLNPDIAFIEDVFPRLLIHLDSESVALVAPLVIDSEGRVQDTFRRIPHPLSLLRRRLTGASEMDFASIDPDGCVRPDWIAGMFLLGRTEVFRSVDGFDERYFLYFEDVDLGARCLLQGYSLVVDTGVRVIHEARRSSRRRLWFLLRHLASAVRFFASEPYRSIRSRKDRRHELAGVATRF
jgi:N-acetylglucosaminyl-diphospho-decaprenol L-rhamnosyltransferase